LSTSIVAARSSATGFSQNTGNRWSTPRTMSSACASVAVAITRASMPPANSASGESTCSTRAAEFADHHYRASLYSFEFVLSNHP